MTPEFEAYDDDALPTENSVVSRIEFALDDVVDDLELDHRRSDSIKRQKYIYLAVDYFTNDNDYPLTYSWYKWGISQPAGPSEASDPQTRRPESAGAKSIFATNQSQFEKFFKTGIPDLALEEWWEEENHLSFLQQFYTVYGHPEYRDVYLSNIDVLQTLTDIQQSLYRGENPVTESMYDRFCGQTSSLKQAILLADGLEDTYDELSECLNLIEDVVMILSKPESEVIKQGHHTAFDELKKFYQEHMWLIVANKISIKTAEGNHRSDLIRRSESNLSNLRSRFSQELSNKREICRQMNLLPGIEDYSNSEKNASDFSQKFDEFMHVVDGTTTCE